MIAVMNDIYVIDGYHNIYPLNYKKIFSIIKEELENNQKYSDYYNKWEVEFMLSLMIQTILKLTSKKQKKLGQNL